MSTRRPYAHAARTRSPRPTFAGNWVGTSACVLLLLVALVLRLRREEEAMIDALGDAYVDFARDRARLVPFVW
jgi:protein-S-isoprenylcysteine O-methyltransferase Ste14